MEEVYLLILFALTSLGLYAAGRRGLGLPRRGLRPALLRMLECVGLTLVLAIFNMAVGFGLVLALRPFTGSFLSLYLNTDSTLLTLSLLQAIALQWWMREGEDAGG